MTGSIGQGRAQGLAELREGATDHRAGQERREGALRASIP